MQTTDETAATTSRPPAWLAATAVLTLALAAPLHARPQGPGGGSGRGTLAGRVTLAASGEAAPHATVLISRLDRRVEADRDGRYRFHAVPPGVYQVVASMAGGALSAETRTVEVRAGVPATADFALSFAAHSEEITVTASAREETAFDTISAVTSLSRYDLERDMAPTLGQVLDGQPGVARRSFGPGSDRPIIRGFDGDRVLVMDDGVRTGTLASQSGDHGELFDASAVDRLEVVKGPATLLYGSNAIGGVVNAVSRKHGFREDLHDGFSGGVNGVLGSTSEYGGGSGRFEYAGQGWSVWAAAGGQRTGDYDTPVGKVENSGTRFRNGFAGFGRYGGDKFFSVEYKFDDGEYGVPFVGELHEHGEHGEEDGHDEHGEEGEHDEEDEHDEHGEEGEHDEHGEEGEHDEDGEEGEHDEEELNIDIDARRHRVRLAGGMRDLGGWFERLRVTFDVADWNHVELENGEPATDFNNRQYVYRAVVEQAARGRLNGRFGVWGQHRDYEVIGEEALAPPVTQSSFAAFTLQELDFGRTRLQFGGRIEHNDYDPDSDGFAARSFTGVSGSVGVHARLWRGGALVANLSSNHRAPALEELYNFGPHVGNLTFEIGAPDLGDERSIGFDVSLRHHNRRAKASFNYFLYDIADFVFLAPTGAEEDGLVVANYAQGDSRYHGFEGKLDVQVHSRLWLNAAVDWVGAELTGTDTPLPRIPPLRGRFGLDFRHGGLSLRPELVVAGEQTDLFPTETPTDGYQVVNLKASYAFTAGNVLHNFTVNAFNLTDELYRSHTSFIKDRAPEIGRGVRFTYSLRLF